MRPFAIVLGTVLAASSAAPLAAQKPHRESPTLVTSPPAPTSAPQAHSTADSAHAKGTRPSPTLMGQPAADSTHRPTTPNAAVTQQAVRPTNPAVRGPTVAAFTAGLAMDSYASEGDEAMRRYVARLTQRLDSTIATLIGVFRGTTGQPLAGAESPAALSQREKDRWARCRDLHYDLQSYGPAMHDLMGDLPQEAAVQRAGEQLDSALTALQATSGCDDVSSMIMAPDRWTPWPQQYQSTAHTFYRDWYNQVREVADRNRALVIALNGTLPATARTPVPPGVARTPPYAGAGPR
jgi:hypothetical protein